MHVWIIDLSFRTNRILCTVTFLWISDELISESGQKWLTFGSMNLSAKFVPLKKQIDGKGVSDK